MKINVKKLNIKQAEKRLNNKELCEAANIGLLTLTMIKANKRECQPKTIGKLAKALEVNVTDLIEQEN